MMPERESVPHPEPRAKSRIAQWIGSGGFDWFVLGLIVGLTWALLLMWVFA